MITKKTLLVKAVPNVHIREINDNGTPMMALRFVGKSFNVKKQEWEVLNDGQIVCYHSYYLRCLKEETLLPMNKETAAFANVSFNK